MTTPFHIAGFFDGPWMFIVIVLVSAVVNWLSKRREEKAAQEGNGGEDKTPASVPADWEERLRRMLGEELPSPTPGLPPKPEPPAPPLRRPAAPPIIRPTAPAMRPPPVEIVPVALSSDADVAVGGVGETIRRFEKMDAAVMTPVRPIGAMGSRRSGLAVNLRQPQAARQAFMASLVFGPPKGLEE